MLALSIPAMIGLMWLTFWALSTTVVVCFFAWAIRHGQFRNQKRAARLALEAGDLEDQQPPEDDAPEEEQKE